MRLAGQVKTGFYPVPPSVIVELLQRLTVESDRTAILDPCCGKGAALAQLAAGLQLTPNDLYAVEVDARRGALAAEALPGANLLQPADCLSVACTAASFSFVWCNPPYDDEIGGGRRYEYSFLVRMTDLLSPGGLLAFAVPQKTAHAYDVLGHLSQWYEDVSWFEYPDEDRHYTEVVILAVRRREPREERAYSLRELAGNNAVRNYVLHRSVGPRKWAKGGYTDDEAVAVLAGSRLQSIFQPSPPAAPPRPGLQLNEGQRALILAGGFLDGVVKKQGYLPIVVKATPYKEAVTLEPEVDEDEQTGKVKTTTVIQERILLRVRALRTDGTILTLKQE
jgi:hypothetical protein